MTEIEIKQAAVLRLTAIQEQVRQLTDEAIEIVANVLPGDPNGFDDSTAINNAAIEFQQAIDEAKDAILD